MNKPKPCKGINKAHGYKGCGKLTAFRKYGLCDSCRSDWLLNTEAGRIVLEKATLKATKPRLDNQKALEKAFKERKYNNSLKASHNTTKQLVHKYIRTRDEGKPCISCGVRWTSDFHAGHFFKAELYETIKYHTDNIHGQCPSCNIHLEGNLEKYIINLPKRIGEERFKELMKLAEIDKRFTKVWNLENLKELRKSIKKLLKDLNQC